MPSSTDGIGRARDKVRSWLTERRCEPDVVSDVELITSELVTNALQHADGASSLSIALEDGSVVVAVAHRGDPGDLPATETWRPAEPDQVTGRGLGIVAAVADAVRLHHDGTLVTVEARRRIDGGASDAQRS